MKTGHIKTTNFDQLESKKLRLELPVEWRQYRTISNCATAALSLLTGLSPNYVQSLCKYPGKNGWYIEDMVTFLDKRGYSVTEVTRKSVTNVYWQTHPLNKKHCLLVVSWMNTEETSALVLHNNKSWHNLNQERTSPMYFLNKPTHSVYIIQHPSWK